MTVEYPFLNFHFRLDITGLDAADFSECTGLSSEIGTEDFREGGENDFVWKLPTGVSQPNLVLKRGLSASRDLWEWYERFVTDLQVELRDGKVELLDEEDTAIRAWAFTGAYPVKLTGPDLDAMNPAVAIETIELVHRGLTLIEV